jgi:hypothetical protein
MAERAFAVAARRLSAEVWLGFSNTFEQDSTDVYELFIDLERLLSTTIVRYGIAEGLELGGRLTFETTGGGVLDPFILRWHNLFGLGNANRERYPANQYEQRLRGANNVELLDIGPRTLALTDVRLFAKWEAVASSDRGSVLGLRAVTRIPTGSGFAGARSDFAFVALGQLSFETWYLHGMIGASTVRASPELEAMTRRAAGHVMLGIERAFNQALAALVQFSVATPVLKGFNHRELDRAPTNLVFGLAGRWGDEWRWDVSFQEDVPSDTPASDFTLGLKLARSW